MQVLRDDATNWLLVRKHWMRPTATILSMLVLWMIAACAPAAASTEVLEREVIGALQLSEFGAMSPEPRKILAVALLKYWSDFDNRIPRNSPSATKWLSEELGNKNSARVTRAINTPEYAIRRLADHVELCLSIHQKLAEDAGNGGIVEMYLWLKATQCYSNDGLKSYLEMAGLSDGTYDGSFKMVSFGMIMNAITGKIANAIIGE